MKINHLMAASALLLSVGCKDTLKNAAEAPNNMVEMKNTTGKMNETMQGMNCVTYTMYLQMRQKDARDKRDEEINIVVPQEIKKEMANKITAAAAIYKGYEYNLFAQCADEKRVREELLTEAAKEHMRLMSTIIASTGMDVSPADDDEPVMALHALSVALHEKNSFQHFQNKNYNLDEISFLEMIENAFKAKKAMESGELYDLDSEDYRSVILSFEKEAHTMLNARWNMLAGMAISRMITLDEKQNGFLKGVSNLLKKLKKTRKKWSPQFDKLNFEQQDETALWLEKAAETKAFMDEMGLETYMDKNLKKILKNMNLLQINIGPNAGDQRRKEKFNTDLQRIQDKL